MRVTHFSCGPAINESEQKAFTHLKTRLLSVPGDGEWVLLTNLAFSMTHQMQSDEIDLIAIGPPGVRVIEVKHWTAQWVETNTSLVEKEADKVAAKARKIGTTLRKIEPSLPRVDPVFLLTQEPSKVKRLAEKTVKGVRFFALNEWKDAIDIESLSFMSVQQVKILAGALEPKSSVAIDGSLRRLAGYVNLELNTVKEERFHRIYKGSHSARQDRVILHLYDLSAIDGSNAEEKAKREFEALRQLQLYRWAPRIMDSFQEAPGYSGEMFFFTLVDPAAPSIKVRAEDDSWKIDARLDFSRKVIVALKELHECSDSGTPIIHRNLTSRTILVKYDNTPILAGFNLAKLPHHYNPHLLPLMIIPKP